MIYVQDVEGEVMAWDQATKVLIIKSESTTRSNLSNVQIINLDFVSDVKVRESAKKVFLVARPLRGGKGRATRKTFLRIPYVRGGRNNLPFTVFFPLTNIFFPFYHELIFNIGYLT